MSTASKRKERKQADPELMALAEAGVRRIKADISTAFRDGTVKVIAVPEAVKRKLRQSV